MSEYRDVPLFAPDEDDFDNSDSESFHPPKKKKAIPWRRVIESEVEPEEAVKQEGVWKKESTKNTYDGKKVYYTCKYGSNCEAKLYILYPSDGSRDVLYRSDIEHGNHDKVVRGIPPAAKEEITQLFKDGIRKPKEILRVLRERPNAYIPSENQLRNFLTSVRTSVLGRPTISYGELLSFVSEKSAIPENDDDTYVCDFKGDLDLENGESFFRLAFTTKRLIGMMIKSNCIQADATYKLNWNNFPVLIVGVTDRARRFHPTAMAVTKGETEEDFEFIFSAVAKAAKEIFDFEFSPEYLVADAAGAITNGFSLAFQKKPSRIMCYYHVMANVKKKLNLIKSEEKRAQILSDIKQMQTITSSSLFDIAVALFEKKWKLDEADFFAYFSQQWLITNRNWYEGFALDHPSTNNGLEATNAVIKKEGTLRERLPLPRFFSVADKTINGWSCDRNGEALNGRGFQNDPCPKLPLWTKSFQWAVSNAEVKQGADETFYIRPSVSQRAKLTTLIEKKKSKEDRKDWRNLDDFFTSVNSLWEVKNLLPNSYLQATCTCPEWSKAWLCKHVLGLAIRFKYCQAPDAAKNVLVGKNRKRGRPTLAKPALIRQ